MVRRFLAGTLCLISVGLLPGGEAHAQVAFPDTVSLPQVTVAGNRYVKYAAGSRTQTLDTLLLQRQPGQTLADMLQQRSPLYLKSYGNGMTATAAFRGTTASHTVVLWNGFNIALPTLGLSDLALLPPAPNTQVSLQHGPSGALHGSGSVGGSILLENPAIFQPQQRVQLQQEVGSFGHRRTAASGSFSNGRVAVQSSFTRTAVQNDFRFKDVTAFGQPWQTQENAAFSQTSVSQDLHFKLGQSQQVSVRGWYVKTHRQVQPSMGSANNQAEQEDENLRLMAEWQGQIGHGTTTVRAAYFNDRLDYQDAGSVSLSKVSTYQSQLEHERTLLPNLLLQVGAEGQLFKAEVGGYGEAVEEQRISAYAWLRYDPIDLLQISFNVRQAWVEGFNPPLTPTLGANLQALQTENHTLTAKANLSRSYRVPTLNDRYWRPGGNPDLQPENGWGYEAGLAHEFKQNRISGTTEATAYKLRVQDWIQWQPSATGGYSEPVNLQTVRGHGSELDTRWKYQVSEPLAFSAGAAYAYTISEQKLPNAWGELQDRQLFYVPKHKVVGWAQVQFHRWWLAPDVSFTSARFTDADNTAFLPAFALLNASTGYTFKWRSLQAVIMAHAYNLTNATYQTMEYRAMPLRHYRLSVSLTWHRDAVSTSNL